MIDGHTSTTDLGSIICHKVTKDATYGTFQIREYYGLSTDFSKLPKYTDMATGSSFYAVDTGALWLFDNVNQTWIAQ